MGAAANSGCRHDESANQEEASSNGLAGRRFLTFNSVIRVNQIEVTRTRNEGFDEYDRHTPENVQALRQALAEGWPGAPMTWAFSWRALHDERERYATLRRLVPEFHDRYGDDVTFIPGAFFPNAYNTREQVNRDLHEGLAVGRVLDAGRVRSRLEGRAPNQRRYRLPVPAKRHRNRRIGRRARDPLVHEQAVSPGPAQRLAAGSARRSDRFHPLRSPGPGTSGAHAELEPDEPAQSEGHPTPGSAGCLCRVVRGRQTDHSRQICRIGMRAPAARAVLWG